MLQSGRSSFLRGSPLVKGPTKIPEFFIPGLNGHSSSPLWTFLSFPKSLEIGDRHH